MTLARTKLPDVYPEGATAYLSATITDTDGVTPLANADTVLTTLTLTLFEDVSCTVINSCTARNILNANGGSVSAAGALVVRLDPADMARSTGRSALHVALITWTWGTPLKTGRHEIAFVVADLALVT